MDKEPIQLRSVSKTYGQGATRVEALREIDLTVGRGEGSGKSTLLHLVSAFDTPTSGELIANGQNIAQLDDDALALFRRRHIGLVFQFFNLLPTLDARENVLLPIMLERKALASDLKRADQLLAEVGLEARAAHRIHRLSGGEMQRVAIARALILEPQLILADEPTGNLDSDTGKKILTLLRALCDNHAHTVIMVTHDLSAAAIGDRRVFLKDGRIVGDDRVSATHPAVKVAE